MSLYLCVFSDGVEVDGVDIGSYSDYGRFVDAVCEFYEGGEPGTVVPQITYHSDCEGEWSVADCGHLLTVLPDLAERFKGLSATADRSGWQRGIVADLGNVQASLYDCFMDADGEPVIDRIRALCELAIQVGEPVLFQ